MHATPRFGLRAADSRRSSYGARAHPEEIAALFARGLNLVSCDAVVVLNRREHPRHAAPEDSAVLNQSTVCLHAMKPEVLRVGIAGGQLLGELRIEDEVLPVGRLRGVEPPGRVTGPFAARLRADDSTRVMQRRGLPAAELVG